jgi:cyclic dehypoxanthinyl futalosine synthase
MTYLEKTIDKVASYQRIGAGETLTLLQHADFLTLARLANKKRMKLHPEPVVTFVVDRNINYTNVCVSECLFCAFYRPKAHAEAYILSEEELNNKIEETILSGGTQILLQGGMHPDLDMDDYCNMLSGIKKKFDIHIHGFSPPEIVFLAKKSFLSISDTLKKLMDSGLDSMPGGGAEILVDRVRKKISPLKCTSDQWLGVMRTAHHMGLRTTATMMFGHVETYEDIIAHLLSIRELQDETGGFTAFIPWTFQPLNTRIDVAAATSAEYLKILAVSRIVLDNISNIQASWVTQGEKIAQLALFFGANDMGSTMIEENVVAAAGVKYKLPKEEIIRIVKNAGFKAAQRDCYYHIVRQE